jgi:8-oxo-dGTP pyrophosphatase MutT (NUDIX family)
MSAIKQAATLVLAARAGLSSHGYDYRVLMVVRASKSRFMPGASVFPGGVLEDCDNSIAWCEALSTKDALLHYKVAAIRETFEEAGFLLGEPRVDDSHNAQHRTDIHVLLCFFFCCLIDSCRTTRRNSFRCARALPRCLTSSACCHSIIGSRPSLKSIATTRASILQRWKAFRTLLKIKKRFAVSTRSAHHAPHFARNAPCAR